MKQILIKIDPLYWFCNNDSDSPSCRDISCFLIELRMQEPTEKSLDTATPSLLSSRYVSHVWRIGAVWSGFPGMALAQVTMDINGG